MNSMNYTQDTLTAVLAALGYSNLDDYMANSEPEQQEALRTVMDARSAAGSLVNDYLEEHQDDWDLDPSYMESWKREWDALPSKATQ